MAMVGMNRIGGYALVVLVNNITAYLIHQDGAEENLHRTCDMLELPFDRVVELFRKGNMVAELWNGRA